MLSGETTDWFGIICNYSLQTTRSEFDSSEYEVRRRYQDFLWLRSRLEENHPTLIVHVCIRSLHHWLTTPVLLPLGPVFGWLPHHMSQTLNIHSFSHCMRINMKRADFCFLLNFVVFKTGYNNLSELKYIYCTVYAHKRSNCLLILRSWFVSTNTFEIDIVRHLL